MFLKTFPLSIETGLLRERIGKVTMPNIEQSKYSNYLAIKERNTKKHVENIIFFFDQMLRRFPDNYAEIPLDSLVVASTSLGQDVQHEISRRIQVSEGQANTLNYLI